MSIFEIIGTGLVQLSKGGMILIPLIIYSIWSHTIIFERMFRLRRNQIIPSNLVTRSIYDELVQGNPEAAVSICNKRPSPLTNIFKAGIQNHGRSEEALKVVLKVAINNEKPVLYRYLSTLSMLALVSMYTGLLGTILGMTASFNALWRDDSQIGKLPEIANGISEALLTTAAGLIVAVPTYIAYHYFTNQVRVFMIELERYSMSLIRFLSAEERGMFDDELENIRDWTMKESGEIDSHD